MKTPKPKDVDSYIAGSSEEARPILDEIRNIIVSTVPEAEESISWNVPFYRYHGELVGFAAYKNHVSFGFGADVLQNEDRNLLEEKGYVIRKGTMQIKFGQQVPADAIKKLLNAKTRMNEAAGRKDA